MSEPDMSEVMKLLNGNRMSVLRQLDQGTKDIRDIADEIDRSEGSVRSAYLQLKQDGYVENDTYAVDNALLTPKARKAITMADEAASIEPGVEASETRVREIKSVNTDSVMYKGGYLYEEVPEKIGRFEEGQYSEIVETDTYMGMQRVDVVDHPVEPEE